MLAICWVRGAHAIICQPTPHYLYVGTGTYCTYPTIQEALGHVACPNTTVVATTYDGETYNLQKITISNISVTVAGSGNACASPPPVCDPSLGCGGGVPAKVAITGDGADPVFTVNGSGTVTIANFDISGGVGSSSSLYGGGGIGDDSTGGHLTLDNVKLHDNSGGYGGGVAFYGDGTLTLDGATILGNSAVIGGGGVSAISSYIGHVEMVIDDNPSLPTEIASNQAQSYGGGVYASGSAHLLAVAAANGSISIHDNIAGTPPGVLLGCGGGIYFEGTAFADIGLPGAGIYANQAGFGGGICVGASSVGNAVLRVFSTDPEDPTDIYGNSAADAGGGLLVGTASSTTHATACLFDAAVEDNAASAAGTAIQVEGGGRLVVNPDSDPDCGFSDVVGSGAVHCDPANADCNEVGQNVSSSASAPDTPATIGFNGAAQIAARRWHISDNVGDYAVRGVSATGADVAFSECLFDRNTMSDELVNVQGAPISFDGCTFADDSISNGTAILTDSGLSLTRSIVSESAQAWNANAAGLITQYLIIDGPKLPADNTVAFEAPGFVDAANGDYHLQASSPAIDYAPTGSESGASDLDGLPREADLPGVANLFGYRDLGAYEYPLPDEIFRDGFDLAP